MLKLELTQMAPGGSLFSGAQMRIFGATPQGALMFRQQHAWLRAATSALLAAVEPPLDLEAAAAAWSLGMSLHTNLQIHREFEIWHVRRTLAYDPKARTIAEQCDREIASAIADLASLFRRHPCASDWFGGRESVLGQVKAIQERMVTAMALEEREVFPAYDRHHFVKPNAVAA